MELRFPHRVEYDFVGPATVDEVIATLEANRDISTHLGGFLEELYPGLTITQVELHVDDISSGSLKEAFFIAFIAVFQEQLQSTIPQFLEHATGIDLPDQYNVVVTASFLLLLYLGTDYLQKFAVGRMNDKDLRDQVDLLISEVARNSGNSENEIRKALDRRFAKKSVLGSLARAAMSFFRPSKARDDNPIKVDRLQLPKEVIKAAPKNVNLQAMNDDRQTMELFNVDIEVRATDSDAYSKGWGAIIPSFDSKRRSMKLMPGIDRELLREKKFVKGDVIAILKDNKGKLTPSSYQLLRVHDKKSTIKRARLLRLLDVDVHRVRASEVACGDHLAVTLGVVALANKNMPIMPTLTSTSVGAVPVDLTDVSSSNPRWVSSSECRRARCPTAA